MRTPELRSSGRWMIRYRTDGRETSRTFTRRADAVAFARALAAQQRQEARQRVRSARTRAIAHEREAERHRVAVDQAAASSRPLAAELLPAGPLLALIDAAERLSQLPVDPTPAERAALHRARRVGVLTERAADQLSVRLLGLIPMEIWG